MPHLRERHLLNLLLKRKKLWPVLGVLGPRQIGKSTLLREQLGPKINARYISIDRQENLDRAIRSPGLFVAQEKDESPLIIDEVQKAPVLFDSIKAEVDELRIPGRYILSGSAEFSKRSGIRESLTGRIGLTYLFPFTIQEVYQRSLNLPFVGGKTKSDAKLIEVKTWLERGGMPGACFLRDEQERNAYFESYLDTVCFRDLSQISGSRFSGKLAMDILYSLATLTRPTLSELTSQIRVDSRKIKNHLEALVALFIVHPVSSHPKGIGRDRFLIFDSGLANYLGAPISRRFEIWALNECLAQHEYSGLGRPRLYYYESAKHSRVDLLIESNKSTRAFIFSEDESPGNYYDKTVNAFHKKFKGWPVSVLSPVREKVSEKNYSIVPWNNYC